MTKNVPPPPEPAHESSSLFSLSSLEERAAGKHEPVKTASEDEGSGLLDIHALTEAAAHSNRVVPRPTPMPALLKSPVVPAAPAGMPTRVKVALGVMGVTIFALGGATLYLAMRQAPALAVQAEPAAERSAPSAMAPAAAPAQVTTAAPTTVVREAQPADVAAAAAPSEPKQRTRASRSAPEAASAKAPAAKPAVAPAPQQAAKAPADRTIDDLLDGALKPGVKAAKAAPMAVGSATPSRNEVLAAMQAVTPKVKACGGTGMAVVKVTLSGRTGHVTDVVVDGQSDAKARACIMREVSRAKLAPFTSPSFSVTYPFKL